MSVEHEIPLSLLQVLELDDITPEGEDKEGFEGGEWSTSSLRDRVVESIDSLDYTITIDKGQSLLKLFSRTGELIGTIGKGTYKRGKIFKKSHLFKKIEEDYRGRGYGTALMQEYIDAGFELPDFEVTGVYESYLLLVNFGYIFHSMLNPNNGNEITTGLTPSPEDIKTLIQKGYTIKLQKTD